MGSEKKDVSRKVYQLNDLELNEANLTRMRRRQPPIGSDGKPCLRTSS